MFDPVWICPNLTLSDYYTINIDKEIQAKIVSCDDNSTFDSYANGTECSVKKLFFDAAVAVNTISTNFDPRIYQ